VFFKDIIGQDSIKKQLIESAQKGTVPHSHLFCGQAGTGAFPLAFAYARYLNCRERTDTDSCGKCSSCLKYNDMVHPDLHFIFPIVKEKKKEICDDYIREWRDFLSTHRYFDLNMWLSYMDVVNKQALIYAKESDDIIRKVHLRIYEAEYRILLIWMPERMHITCANKLLKLIEEPPKNTIILMVSEDPDKILGTILSRSQRINIGPIQTEALAGTIATTLARSFEEARQLAHMSHGNYLAVIDAINVSEENAYFLEQFKLIMRNSWMRNVKGMKLFAEEMASIGRERQKNFLAYCQRLVRENFMYRFQAEEINYMNQDERTFSTKFAPFINERNVFDFIEELSESERHIAQNGNAKMIFFDLALHITVLLKK
jgi:DNA polymerase-3 subunit delta'